MAMTKVLIIDDDRKHSELLQTYFKRFGINLICAYDANEGFRKLQEMMSEEARLQTGMYY